MSQRVGGQVGRHGNRSGSEAYHYSETCYCTNKHWALCVHVAASQNITLTFLWGRRLGRGYCQRNRFVAESESNKAKSEQTNQSRKCFHRQRGAKGRGGLGRLFSTQRTQSQAKGASLLGQTIKLNAASFTVIGVTPNDFMGTNINVPDLWIPMRLRPLISGDANVLHDRENNCCALYGRLAPGISLPEAQAEMTLLADHLRTLHAPHSEGRKPLTITLTPGSHLRPVSFSNDPGLVFAILLIMGAVGLVLLISCANVAGLQLARSVARQREMGVRLSLGASRLRVIRQLLTESALLGLLAGAVSMLMTWWTLHILMVEIATSLPLEWGALAVHLEPDLHVFGYVFGISLLAGVLFGLAPALESSRPNVSSALKEEGARFGLRLGNARLRDLMVGTQVAVCRFLIIGASLLIRGSMRSLEVSPGYETKRVVWLDLNFPPGFGYTHAKTLSEVQQLLDRFRSLPGVVSVAIGRPPNGGGLRTAAVGLNGSKPTTDNTTRTIYYSYVTPNYLKTLGIPLVRGHGFAERAETAEATAILSESAAEELWPGKDPIGQTVVLA